MYNFNVFFTTETVKPVLLSYSFNPDLKILTLTYSEKVKLNFAQGILPFTMTSYQYNGNTGYSDYSEAGTVDNVIAIVLSNVTLYGDYTFTLPEGFALDDYRNQSISRTIIINNGNQAEDANKLAEPYSIHQSDANHSLIYIEFADKLDAAAAMDPINYNLSGAAVEEVKLLNNTVDGAVVQLVLVKGSVTASGAHRILISGLKGYNGNSSEMVPYSTQINLTENVDPVLKSVTYDPVEKDIVRLTFTEEIQGDMSVTVQERSTGNAIGCTVTVSDDTVIIKLGSIPADGTYLRIYVQENDITDLNNNESTINPVLNVFVNY